MSINVELRANQDLVRVEDNGTVLPPVRDENVPAYQIAVSNNDLVRYENNRISPLPDIQSVAALSPRAPAESTESQAAAFLNAARTTLYSIVPGQPARALTTRATLSRPSFGRYDWVWTAGPGCRRRHRGGGLPAGRRGGGRQRTHRDPVAGMARRAGR